jgi:hypothetical protein
LGDEDRDLAGDLGGDLGDLGLEWDLGDSPDDIFNAESPTESLSTVFYHEVIEWRR